MVTSEKARMWTWVGEAAQSPYSDAWGTMFSGNLNSADTLMTVLSLALITIFLGIVFRNFK